MEEITLEEAIEFWENDEPEKAMLTIIKYAEEGNMAAQFYLAESYLVGYGVSESMKKAGFWCNKAAEQGHLEALYNMGSAYMGWGIYNESVEKDEQKGAELIIKAAKQGYVDAIFDVGRYYYYGHYVEQDKIKGAYLIREAADKGNKSAKTLIKMIERKMK